jgi:phosphatidylserine decarboxylase
LKEKHINNRLPFVRFAIPFILSGIFLSALFLWIGRGELFLIFSFATSFIAFFFRDPDRSCYVPERAILSPADGKILEVKELGDKIKISIFMSLMDVHVNRIPVSGQIKRITHTPGRFFRANLESASKENERNEILLKPDDSEEPFVLIQIAGILARRIICWVREGDRVTAGQRFGLICFGSRVELFVNKNCEIVVKPDQKVKAGMTVLGYIQKEG